VAQPQRRRCEEARAAPVGGDGIREGIEVEELTEGRPSSARSEKCTKASWHRSGSARTASRLSVRGSPQVPDFDGRVVGRQRGDVQVPQHRCRRRPWPQPGARWPVRRRCAPPRRASGTSGANPCAAAGCRRLDLGPPCRQRPRTSSGSIGRPRRSRSGDLRPHASDTSQSTARPTMPRAAHTSTPWRSSSTPP